MQTGNTDYIYKNDLDKACFQHDMAYGKYKYLTKITQSDKVLRDKAFEITSNTKYDVYERELAPIGYKVFDKKSKGSCINQINSLQMNFSNQLLENLKQQKLIHHLKTIFGCKFS